MRIRSWGVNDNDAAIAEKLRSIYPDVTAALGSSEAAQLRLNKVLADARGYAVDFSTALVGGLQQGLNGFDALGKAAIATANSIATNFAKLGTQDIFGALKGGLTQLTSSGAGASSAPAAGSAATAGLSGILGGSLSGILGGGPTGGLASLAIGTAISLVSGVITSYDQQEQQWQQAQQTWAPVGENAEQFVAPATADQLDDDKAGRSEAGHPAGGS